MTVLILSAATDPHARAVSKHLDELRVKHLIWSYDKFLKASQLSFSLSNGSFHQSLKACDEEAIELNELQSIWFRRPGRVYAPAMPEAWVGAMIESEAIATIGGALRAARNCLMVNHPGRDTESLFKLWQLECARRVGLSVPDTLVTNDPAAAREFYDRLDGRVIYKLISERTNFCFPTYAMPAGIPTLKMRAADLEHLGQVK
ncbi:MAG: MvdC/MvdD family ATP grasp protein, partial [Terriglobales bacterium]